MMNFELDQDQKDFLDTFRDFCEKEIKPHAEEGDATGDLPRSHFKKLAEIGYLGLLHRSEYGGQGASYLLATLAQVILSEACGASFFTVGASAGLFGLPLQEFGTDEQCKKLLPSILSGDKIGALAITEPGAGSVVSRLECRAQRRTDGYYLNGQKTYITNAPICDYALVLARLEDETGKQLGLTHFILDCNQEGVSRGKPMKKMGLRASPTGELFFEDAFVPTENLLGKPGRGFHYTMEAFNRERLSLAAYSLGTMKAALEDCKRYTRERKAFGKRIGKHQGVAHMTEERVRNKNTLPMINATIQNSL